MKETSTELYESLLEYIFTSYSDKEMNYCASLCFNRDVAEEICYEAYNLAAGAIDSHICSILEINSSYGNFTRYLSRLCDRMVCVEKDARKTELNKIRNPRDGISFTDTIEDGKYDFIFGDFTAVTPSEYGYDDLGSLFSKLKKCAPEGRIYLILPNESGDFSVSEKYSADDIREGLKKAGIPVNHSRIMYAYPGVRTSTMFLFSEGRLPAVSECFFHKDTCKSGEYSELIENHSYADAVIAEISAVPFEYELEYSKLSLIRRDELRIRTDIIRYPDGSYGAAKRAIGDLSVGHIERLRFSEQKIKELFDGTAFTVNKIIAEEEKSLIFEFLKGDTLFDIIVQKYWENPDISYELILRYAQILKSKAYDKFTFTDEFRKVFGDTLKDDNFYTMPYTDIDMCFDNIIINDNNEWQLIDYEFCFDFPIPVDFVIYRAFMQLNKKLPKTIDGEFIKKAFALLGIETYINTFGQMETAFQKYALGENIYQRNIITESADCALDYKKSLKALRRDISRKKK